MYRDSVFSGDGLFDHWGRVERYCKIGRTPPPVTVELDLTTACNHRCPDCVGGRRSASTLSRREAEGYLRQMADYGVRGVFFTGGGEPLLHPDAVALIAFARRLGLDVGLSTNGARLTRRACASIVRSCTFARVSVDAADAATYRLTHGVDGFGEVVEKVRMLGDANAAAGEPCTVGVGYLTDERTRGGMVEAAQLFAMPGINYLHFRPFHFDRTDISGELAECRLCETDRYRIRASAQKYSRFREAERGYRYCHGSYFVGVIEASADVPLCCHYRAEPRLSLGNLRGATFADIWEGPRRGEILATLDVRACVPFCRADALSRLVARVIAEREHTNFI